MTRVDRFKVMTLRLGFRREGFGLGYVWRCLDGRVGPGLPGTDTGLNTELIKPTPNSALPDSCSALEEFGVPLIPLI